MYLPVHWLGLGFAVLDVFDLSPVNDSPQTAVAFILTSVWVVFPEP